jgi:hypothetical protein
VSALIHAEDVKSVRNLFIFSLKFMNQILKLEIQGFIQLLWGFAWIKEDGSGMQFTFNSQENIVMLHACCSLVKELHFFNSNIISCKFVSGFYSCRRMRSNKCNVMWLNLS